MIKKYTLEELKEKEIVIQVRNKNELDDLITLFNDEYTGEYTASDVEAMQWSKTDKILYSVFRTKNSITKDAIDFGDMVKSKNEIKDLTANEAENLLGYKIRIIDKENLR